MLAVNTLMADPRDLLGQPLEQLVVQSIEPDSLHARLAGILDPKLTRPVDDDLCYRLTLKPWSQRRKVGIEVNAAWHDCR